MVCPGSLWVGIEFDGFCENGNAWCNRKERAAGALSALQHDPNRSEDVLKVDADEDGVGGDDAADALRYLVATKTRMVTQRKLHGL
jgi:hypothetical protein